MTVERTRRLTLATSRDVARVANVSQALVSRAFSGSGRIAPATRERILKAAAELGWQPNALAAGVVTGDAPLVAVITTRLSFEWRAQVLSHLLKAFEARRLKPILFYAESDDEVDRLLGETISWRTRGVIVTAGVVQRARAEAILSRGQFLAALNRPVNHPLGYSVATDNHRGGAAAAALLVEEGRRDVLALAGPEDSWASAERIGGFLEAMRDRQLTATVWRNADMSIEAGRQCAEAFLALPDRQRPDAVFSTNDAMAIGFIDGLRGRGPDIPSGLSIVGFDNLPASSWPPYGLTTFEQPIDRMVEGVLEHIARHQRRGQGDLPPGGDPPRPLDGDGLIRLAPTLVRRATTRATQ